MTYFPRLDTQWIYDITAVWEASIGQNASQTSVINNGCYAAVHPGTNLKIISLNTILNVSSVIHLLTDGFSIFTQLTVSAQL